MTDVATRSFTFAGVLRHQLSVSLTLLKSAVQDPCDCPPPSCHLNAAAQHVSLALTRLAHIESSSRSAAALGPGGAEQPPTAMSEAPRQGHVAATTTAAGGSDRALVDPGAGAGAGGAFPGFPGATYRGLAGQPVAFREGRHRPVGLVDALPKN